MEHALLITPGNSLRGIRKYDRVYYGCEFCQHRLATARQMKEKCCRILDAGKPLTYLTGYVTAAGLERVAEHLRILSSLAPGSEVVFNDWGVFLLLRRDFPRLKPVLGRLLSKQKRDPRAYDFLLNTMRPEKGFEPNLKKKVHLIFMPQPVPADLYEHFQGSVVNSEGFQRFLSRNAVTRIELDNLVWKMKVDAGRLLRISLYYPYAYITTTRLCGLLNMTYRSCARECQDHFFRFTDPLSPARPVPFFLRGNTLFYQAGLRPAKELRRLGVDRIIHQRALPL